MSKTSYPNANPEKWNFSITWGVVVIEQNLMPNPNPEKWNFSISRGEGGGGH